MLRVGHSDGRGSNGERCSRGGFGIFLGRGHLRLVVVGRVDAGRLLDFALGYGGGSLCFEGLGVDNYIVIGRRKE